MHHKSNIFPFTAIVGQELMKTALILNAINPKIGGVLIKGEKGTAKSTAARSLTELLPKIKVVSDCPFFCNPEDVHEMCSECTERYNKGENLPYKEIYMKMVTLPVSATEDRVVGTINLKKALEEKELALEPGILAEVNRGILYIDEVNLLDNHVADLLLDAAAMGYNIIERENISFFHPSNFILIGTMNPEEGDLRPQLLDRFGLCIEVKGEQDIEKRIAIIKARQDFDKKRVEFKKRYEKTQQTLRNKIIRAKKLLPKIQLSDNFIEFISLVCIKFGVDGHRADITTAKTAQTIAAFEGKENVDFEDLKKAMILSLPHRLRKGPFTKQKFDQDEFDRIIDEYKQEFDKKKGITEPDSTEPENNVADELPINEDDEEIIQREEKKELDFDNPSNENEIEQEIQEEDIETYNSEEETPIDIEINMGMDSLEEKILENFELDNYEDDFYNEGEEIIFDVGEGITDQAKQEILKQKMLLVQQKARSRKGANDSLNNSGKYTRFRYPRKDEKITDIAIDATLRAAIVDSVKNGKNLEIEPQHYRIKVRKSPTNILIIFLLDTSGSMAANKRMTAAKGALISLLETIYIRKDKICLITFSGNDANMVIPPTNSVELASNVLPVIPTGGRTPLSKAINKALDIAIPEKDIKGIVPLIVLLSDCKQNVSLYSLNEDFEILRHKFDKYNIPLIVIDTDLSEYNLGFAKEVSEKLDAVYYQLERLQGNKIRNIVATEYKEMTKILDRT